MISTAEGVPAQHEQPSERYGPLHGEGNHRTLLLASFDRAQRQQHATAMVKEFVAELKAKKGTAEHLNNGTATYPTRRISS